MAVAAYKPKMVADGNKRGLHTILTGMELVNSVADFDRPRRLKLSNDNYLEGVRGENICRWLTHALLAKAGVPESKRKHCVDEPQPVTIPMMFTLLRQLNVDCVVYDKPIGSDGRWDKKRLR